MDEWDYGLELLRRSRPLAKARAVVDPYGLDALASPTAARRRGVDGEVAALGVAAHVDLAARRLAGLLEIFEGALLGAHHRVAHGEVLAPAGEGVVGAAEGNVGDVARELHAEGAELLARLVVEVLNIMEELGLGEAPGGRHLLENLWRERGDEAAGCPAVL